MKTIFILVNKNWEVEPVLNAMTGAEYRAVGLPYPDEIDSPRSENARRPVRRALWQLPKPEASTLRVEVWCVQDLMDAGANQSSSEEKYRVLPSLYASGAPDLIIAVGTAASVVQSSSINGSVLIGGQFFLHDAKAKDPNSASNLTLDGYDQLLAGHGPKILFDRMKQALRCGMTRERLLPMVHLPYALPTPADPDPLPAPRLPDVIVDEKSVALGTINVTNYYTYTAADADTLSASTSIGLGPASSVDTTHGLIRVTAPENTPVVYISGIANRVLHYNREATSSHRYQAAFNCGVALGDIVVDLAKGW